MINKYNKFIFLSIFAISDTALSQCAPGIPSAGNPGCVPPNVPGSLGLGYNQGQSFATKATWEKRWGAIAFDKYTDHLSVTNNEPSEQSATKKVMDDCKTQGGRQCHLVFAYYNQCAAIAINEKKIGYGRGPRKSKAENLAMKSCRKAGPCELIYSECSYAVQIE